jgi:unsaturated rhamnogalacturonyl hydrolase
MKSSVFLLYLVLVTYPVASQVHLQLAEKMASNTMETYPDSMVVKKYINHLMQDNQAKSGETNIDSLNKVRPAVWNYEMGVILVGFERLWQATGNEKYYLYLKHMIDHFITDSGSINTYAVEEYNSDHVPPGRQLLTLYNREKNPKYQTAATILYNQILWQPRNRVGGFWHKLKYPTQMWLDGLYMIEPFYAAYSLQNNCSENFDDITNQFVWMEKYSRDNVTGLLYHGWDESKLQEWADKKTGRSPHFWSRAMGWYMMALVDVLDYLPKNYHRRNVLVDILNRLTVAIIKKQDTTSGVWWQITDKPGKAGNYLESSASAMFVYAMSKAVRLKYLPVSYIPSIRKGYEGLLKQFVRTDSSGVVHYINAVSGAGLGGSPYRDGSYEYYVREPKRDDDLKAIGPFIQACIEIANLDKMK